MNIIKEFNGYNNFILHVIRSYESLCDLDISNDVSILAKYHDTCEIIKEFLKLDYKIQSIHIEDPEWNDYTDEYIISICKDDDGFNELWCEPLKGNDYCLEDESALTFILDGCSDESISHCIGNEKQIVKINKL